MEPISLTVIMAIVVSVLLSTSTENRQPTICGQGKYLNVHGNCFNCDRDQFMPYHSHQIRECFPCSRVDKSWATEKLITGCDGKSDYVVACADGFYQKPIGHGSFLCMSCLTECTVLNSKEAHPCGESTNIVCKCRPGFHGVYNHEELLKCTECDGPNSLCETGESCDLEYFRIYVKRDFFYCKECTSCLNDEEEQRPCTQEMDRSCFRKETTRHFDQTDNNQSDGDLNKQPGPSTEHVEESQDKNNSTCNCSETTVSDSNGRTTTEIVLIVLVVVETIIIIACFLYICRMKNPEGYNLLLRSFFN